MYEEMNLPIEEEMLRGAQRFDLSSLGAIYDQFSPGIYRYAMRMLNDEGLAEDCVAETFSRFLKALQSGKGPKDHLQAYLYRIAHNWITDSYRRQAPREVELDEFMKGDENALPERQTESNMAMQQIRTILRSLSPDQRQVLILRFVEGWENEEVAAALGKNVGAIKALQHRALEAVHKNLRNKEIEIEKRFAQ